jgi:hypothetical protein
MTGEDLERGAAQADWQLPPFYCPIEPAIHPEADLIEEQVTAWLDRCGIYASEVERAWLLAINGAELMARVYPNGMAERVALSAEWYLWALGALDDAQLESAPASPTTDRAVELLCRLLRYMETPVPGPAVGQLGNLLRPLGQIMTALRKYATPVQVQRFVDAHRHWMMGTLWQMSNAAHHVVLDMDSYAIQRHASAGVLMFMSWSEITAGDEIPGSEMHDPAVRAMIESAILIIGWDNDVLSYRKETIRDHDSTQNVVTVAARQYRCSTEQAFAEAIAIRNRVMVLFLRLAETIKPRASSAMRAYIDDLGHLIRGNFDWSSASPRYTCLTSQSAFPTPGEPMTITFTGEPPHCGGSPSAIPSIAWWWEQLRR